MSRIGIGVAVAAVAAAGAVAYGVLVLPDQRLRSALDEQIRQLPAGFSAHYDAAHYSLFSRHATITGIVVHADGPHPLDARLEAIELDKPALDAADLWSQAAAAPGTVLRLADTVAARGASIQSDLFSAKLDALRIDAPRLYPAELLRPEVSTLWAAEAALLSRTQPPTPDDLLPLLRAEAAIMAGIAHDGYLLANLHVAAKMPVMASAAALPNGAPAPTGPVDVAYDIRRITADQVERGAMSQAGAEAVSVKLGPMGTFTLDRVAMADIDLRPAIERVLAGAALSFDMLDGVKLGRLEYGGMRMQPPSGEALEFGTFSLGSIAFAHGLPISGELAYGGLHVSRAQLAANPVAVENLNKLGIDGITLSLRLAYQWDTAAQRLAIHDTSLKVDELGALALSADLAGFAADPAWASKANLTRAALRYDDASLVERALRAGAAQHGQPAGPFREQLIGALTQQAGAAGTPPALAKAAQALAAFIATPHSLRIDLAPTSPVPVAALQMAPNLQPPQLVQLLGLTITANQ